MKKAIKIVLSIISSIIIFLVMLPIVLAMLLQIGPVQQWATDTATEILTKKAGSRFSVGKIEIGLFNRAFFEDVIIEDPTGDTMIFVKKINASINGINFLNGKIALGTVTVSGAKVNLHADSTGLMNVKIVFDHFKPKIPNPNPPNFRMTVSQVNLLEAELTLRDDRVAAQRPGSINFRDMHLQEVTFQAQNLNIFNYDIKLAINHLVLREKSGFRLDHLSSPRCGVNQTGMRFADVKLETPQTTIDAEHLNLLYQSWWDYTDFVNKVSIDADISTAHIDFSTIEYFLPKSPNLPLVFDFEGKVYGRVPELSGEIDQLSADGTTLSCNFNILGLPDITQTTFRLTLDHLQTNRTAIDRMVEKFSPKPLSPGVDSILIRCGEITTQGEFYGLLTDFTANCVVSTACGALNANLQVHPAQDDKVRMIGKMSTTDFALGHLLASKALNKTTIDAGVDILLSNNALPILNTNATIRSLDFSGYNYGPIEMNGRFQGKIFEGRVSSSEDPNLMFNADGRFDLTSTKLPECNFELDLRRANLVALGLNRRDSISQVSAKLTAEFTGTTIDNINGSAVFDSILYINHIDTVRTSAIRIASHNSPESKRLTMRSHFADLTLQGRNSYANIFGYLGSMASTYIPAFPDVTEVVTGSKAIARRVEKPREKTYTDGFYTLNIKVKQANNVASIFAPGLEIAEGTTLDFFFDPSKNKFSLNMNADYILKENFYVEDLVVDSRNVADSLSLYMTASEVLMGRLSLPSFSVLGGVRNNRVSLGARFNDKGSGNAAMLNTMTTVGRTSEGVAYLKTNIRPGYLRLDKKNWMITEADITMDTSRVAVTGLGLRNGKQIIAINGTASSKTTDTLTLNLSNVDLAPLSFITSELGYKIGGDICGDVKAAAMFGKMKLFAELDFHDMSFGGYALGNSQIRSILSPNRDRVLFRLTTESGAQPATGFFDIAKQSYGATLKFPKVDLVLLEPLLQGILTATEGTAAVNMTLSGDKNTPSLNGDIHIDRYSAMVDYTKVRYVVTGDVKVRNNRFELNGGTITDPDGNHGTLSAYFDSRYFKDLTFGIDARFTNLMALRTTIENNPLFYGTAFGTGSLRIAGSESATKLQITASTAPGSSIVLPFASAATVGQANFVKFIDQSKIEEELRVRDSTKSHRPIFEERQKRAKMQNELDITMDLQVLPNTTALIEYSNSVMSNIIRGQGRGRLQMHINPSQEIFTLDGPIEIEKGSYRLVIAIADKTFNLESGGRLFWTGDPANPTVDFTGIYKVPRVSLAPLTGDGGEGGSATINCGITLTENLQNPKISFNITAPSATPETQNILRNSLNTEEAQSMQFMSLFFSGGFMPDMSAAGIGTMSGSILSTTGLEFVANQVSSLISNKYFNFKPTFRPRTETNTEEIGFQASASLLQDKILLEVEGNYATSPLGNTRATPFSGGGGVTVLLNKAGTLSLKGFTRVIDRFDETQGLQESGVGIYFRQEFQNWQDLKRRYQEYLERVRQNNATRKEKQVQKVEDRTKGIEPNNKRKAKESDNSQNSNNEATKSVSMQFGKPDDAK